MKHSKTTKSLQELNLLDSYLFGASTENPQNAEFIAKLIIERAMGRRIKEILVMPEKQLAGIDTLHHGIRMDLCIMEYANDNVAGVYDIEPNRYRIKELSKRSRYSQVLTDSKLLSTSEDYMQLPEYVSIWILTQDPFGRNRMVYTVRNKVEEVCDVCFDDGVTKLFLYVYGEEGGSEELRSLLRYFADSVSKNATDEEIKQVHKIVTDIRENRERRMQSMKFKEMLEYEKEESFDEGYDEGVLAGEARGEARGMQAGIETGRLQSIGIYIGSLREFNIQEEDILNSVIGKFGIPKEKAMELMAGNP